MGNRLSRIYTRTGDDGSTGLGDGSRTGKDALRVNAYGTVDEANSAIGVLLAAPGVPEPIAGLLTTIQHQLFDLGGELCIPGHAAIDSADIDALERQLDLFNDTLPPLKEFILPAGARPLRAATWPAPSCAGPSARPLHYRARRACAARRSAT